MNSPALPWGTRPTSAITLSAALARGFQEGSSATARTACGRLSSLQERIMCGIVAYVGRKIAQPVLIEGLKRLEYRGYDSAGVAVVDGCGQLHIRRAVG